MTSELNFKIKVMKINQRQEEGQAIFVGCVKVGNFFSRSSEKFIIDYYKRENGKEDGYQRTLSDSAVNKIKEYILTETDYPVLPTAMLFSSRYELNFKAENGNFGTLEVDNPLYVIDGQHRFEAWKSIMNDNNLRKSYEDYELPVVILSNYSKIKEIEQFFVINSRQKKIKTDLAQRNFLSLAKDMSTSKMIPEKARWGLFATKIVDILNEELENSIWNNNIILPNDSDDFQKTKVISQASFISSLKPFFVGKEPIFNGHVGEHIHVDAWGEFINDYWNMVGEIYPEIINHPKDYSLMKTVGVYSLHLLLAQVVNQLGLGSKILEKQSQSIILKKCHEYLIKVSKDRMKTEFWRSKPGKGKKIGKEHAGDYSSSQGHSKLVAYIMLGL